uniref:FIP-RBD domain-containing protein n=1 Tax=Myripristis murdjan TaxID=586833 RepID=A0A667WMX8_9TELE
FVDVKNLLPALLDSSAASEQQGALLEKREAELKKVKTQVRDLEDYIDNLLLRIMEQTPTLLQVRSRHK